MEQLLKNTFINFSGIRSDVFISAVADNNPNKQGKFMPGAVSHCFKKEVLSNKPDYVVILPWNLKEEIISDLNYMRGGVVGL